MTPISAAALIVAATADAILARVLEVAAAVGLPVETWRAGDPTRALFKALADTTAERDAVQAEFAKGASIQTAEGDWATIRALETFNVERDEATFSAPTVVVDNAAGGVFEFEPGGIVFSASATGATFTNQGLVSIAALTSGISILLVAQQSGSAGTVAANDIDGIVSPPIEALGVSIVSSTAAIGVDEQSDAGLRQECADTLGSFSPNGPADVYSFVARNEDLTGVVGITRAKANGDNTTGAVTVYAATGTAGISGPTVSAIQDAIDLWSTPLCTLATVQSGTPASIAITVSGVPADLQDVVEAAWAEHFLLIDFGGEVNVSALEGVAFAAMLSDGADPATANPVVSVPAADQTLTAAQFPVVGAITWL